MTVRVPKVEIYGPVQVAGPLLDTSVALTGQITVTTAGTAVQGPDVPLTNGAWIQAHPSNTGLGAYGNDGAGDVTVLNGIVLEAGNFGPPAQVANLNELWFDVAVNGEKFCWMRA